MPRFCKRYAKHTNRPLPSFLSTAQKKLSFLDGSDEDSLSESEDEDNDLLSGIKNFDEVEYPENHGDVVDFSDFSVDAEGDFMDDGSGQPSISSSSELTASMSIESQILVRSVQAKIKSIGKMVRYLSLSCSYVPVDSCCDSTGAGCWFSGARDRSKKHCVSRGTHSRCFARWSLRRLQKWTNCGRFHLHQSTRA